MSFIYGHNILPRVVLPTVAMFYVFYICTYYVELSCQILSPKSGPVWVLISTTNLNHWGVRIRVGLGFSIDNTVGGTTYGRGPFMGLRQGTVHGVTELHAFK